MQVQDEIKCVKTRETLRVGVNEFIAQGMLYQALFFAVNAGRYIAEFIGTTEERNQLYGDVSTD